MRLAAAGMLGHDGEQVGWGLLLSLGLHLLLALFIILWPGLGKSRRQSFAPVYRVNLVGAPRLAPPRAAAPPAAPKPAARPAAVKPQPRPKPRVRTRPKPSPKPKEAIGSKKLKAKKLKPKRPAQDLRRQERLLDRKLKRLEARVRQERTLESALTRLERKVAARSGVYASSAATAAGAAGAAAGAGGGQVSLRMQVYYTELWERIRRAWILPAAQVEDTRGLMASVVMRLNRDGSLEKVYLEKSSGNPAYDRSCLRAVEKAAPFPPFPAGINQRSLEVGVNFHSEDAAG